MSRWTVGRLCTLSTLVACPSTLAAYVCTAP